MSSAPQLPAQDSPAGDASVEGASAEVRRLKALADAAFEGLIIHKDGIVLHVNEAAARMVGATPAQVLGMPTMVFAAPESHALIAQNIRENVTTPIEVAGLRLDGTRFPAELQGKTLVIDGETLRVTAIRDLTARKQVEVALARSQASYNTLWEKAADGIGIARTDGTIESYNPSVAKLLGYGPEELVGRNISTIVSRENQAETPIRFQELQRGQLVKGERSLVRKDGSIVQVELNSSPLGEGRMLTIFRDVTERNQLRQQLVQAQKLESVGRLAGGIAHDFNNLLTVVLGNADMLQTRLAGMEHPRLLGWSKDISRAAERAAELTAQLLTFSRKQVVQRTALNLNEVIAETERMFHRIIGEDIAVELDLDQTIPDISVNRSQMVQVVMNLVINARDALPNGGKVELRTRAVGGLDLAGDPGGNTEPLNAGSRDGVEFIVSDNGCGMNKETLSRAFEPFFTTKPVGEGTGLGLATVYGIVKQSDGVITIESEVNRGTSLRMIFPKATEVRRSPRGERRVLAGGPQQTVILLVEDEPAVAQVTEQMLKAHGYTVHVALGPAQALSAIEGLPSCDLLLTDVVMPEMSGPALAEKLRSTRPDLKILYVSGYTEDVLLQKGVNSPALHFLVKPFSARQLLEKVEVALGRGPDSARRSR
ncbi:MAG TPA: PAS domain S-box protein [Polyangiaceae bacterium]|nr:PAS domain S-box protein [Polyangiaceae bacterium]